MKSLWIVYGMTGQYSDRCEWNVVAYPTEELAARHVELAQKVADDIDRRRENRYDAGEGNPYDPSMQMDYTGTVYRHCMIEVREELPSPV